jgi:hypothetical protein
LQRAKGQGTGAVTMKILDDVEAMWPVLRFKPVVVRRSGQTV